MAVIAIEGPFGSMGAPHFFLHTMLPTLFAPLFTTPNHNSAQLTLCGIMVTGQAQKAR